MHVTRTRVRYGETDQGGVAYHANYLYWFELGRTELLRDLGVGYAAFERERGLFLTVTEAELKYHAPARYDDQLEILTVIADVRRVRLRIDTSIRRADDAATLCTGGLWLACVTRESRPVALPDDLRRRLLAWQEACGKSAAPATVKGTGP